VSWLPGRALDRNSAITAMILADHVGERDLNERHRLWPFIENWAGELGLSGADAVTRASQPHPAAAAQPVPPWRQPDREAAD
jgi:hypothetical protein